MSNLVCHDFQEMVWKLSISECRLLLDVLQRCLAADAHFYDKFLEGRFAEGLACPHCGSTGVVDFVARYCDFENRIVRTKHAVACVYYGNKAVYHGAEAKLERNYNGIYAPLLVDSTGWTQDAKGFFWRVVETAGRSRSAT